MKGMNLRVVSVIIALLFVSVAIAGCGNGGADGKKTEQPSASSQPAETQKQAETAKLPSVITYATVPVGGIFNTIAVAQSNLLSQKLGVTVTAEPTPGGVVNAQMLRTKEADITILNSLDVDQMYRGIDQYQSLGPTPIALLLNGHEGYYGIMTTKNSGIKTTADLKGKRIFDDRQGITWVKPLVSAQLESIGLDPEKEVTHLKYQHSNEVIDQIVQGRGDATWGSLSKASLSTLDEAKGAYVVPLSEQEGEAVNKRFPAMHRSLLPEDLPGAPQGTGVIGSYAMLVARQDLSEEAVYLIVKNLLESQKELISVHPYFKEWTPERAVSDPMIPFHPGAVKYFKEIGVWTPELERIQNATK